MKDIEAQNNDNVQDVKTKKAIRSKIPCHFDIDDHQQSTSQLHDRSGYFHWTFLVRCEVFIRLLSLSL